MIVAALHSCSASYAAATPFALSAPPCAPIVRTMTNAAIATPSVAIHARPARRDMPPSWHPTLGGRDGFLVRVMPISFRRHWRGMTGIVPPPSPLADFVGGRSLGAVGPARGVSVPTASHECPPHDFVGTWGIGGDDGNRPSALHSPTSRRADLGRWGPPAGRFLRHPHECPPAPTSSAREGIGGDDGNRTRAISLGS